MLFLSARGGFIDHGKVARGIPTTIAVRFYRARRSVTPSMPELPEVETTRRGIAATLEGAVLTGAIVRHAAFRWPVPADLDQLVAGRRLVQIGRRAKYLLLDLGAGNLILHLGMSGSLRVLAPGVPVEKHDHIDLLLDTPAGPRVLRFRDPRRFGCLLWQPGEAFLHPLLADLGPEPLTTDFTPDYLARRLKDRSVAIKLALMDNHVVVGVGNIYANEALFRAGARPDRPAGSLRKAELAALVASVKQTLAEAIEAGGSSLRDFLHADGKPGYFQQQYNVYGRDGESCHQCGGLISLSRLGQRATFWCGRCQK
jgi:formamidopyrimidine-DNA glycosylase